MKKQKLKQIMACALICATLGTGIVSTRSTTVQAMSFNKVYESTFDCVAKLKDLGKQYYITERLANNETKMEDNRLENLVNSVEEIQSTIDDLRFFQHQFPSSYWKARNTFSEIGDGYQQPIYEWIVDCAIKMNDCATKSFLDEIPEEDKPEVVMHIQKYITGASILNKGVDPAYKGAYQAALDEDQKKLDNLLPKELKEAQNIGKIFGKTYKEQLKCKEELYSDLSEKEKNKLKELNEKLDKNPTQALVDILAECKDFGKHKDYYSTKYKSAFTNDVVNFMLVNMFSKDASKLNNSKIYRFNEAFLNNTENLEQNVTNNTDKAVIATKTIELKKANKDLLNSVGIENMLSFENAFKGITPSVIFNEKELEKEQAEEIKYEDALRKKQEAEKEKAYDDLINKDTNGKTLEEQQEETIKNEDKIIKDSEEAEEKAYNDLISKDAKENKESKKVKKSKDNKKIKEKKVNSNKNQTKNKDLKKAETK